MNNKKQIESFVNYINDKHTQEECIGFSDGYKKAISDMEDNSVGGKFINQDIIDFRHKLIEHYCSDVYVVNSKFCNDDHTNVMTEEKKGVLRDILTSFNIHFNMRGYDIG